MSQTITLYVDGACRGNPGLGGWGAYVLTENEKHELCGGEADTTNNRMELTAAIEGIRFCSASDKLIIWTDSTYVKRGITEWIENWKKKNWKDVKNPDLWKALDLVCKNREIEWNWIKGHAGHAGNEKADQLANLGADQMQAKIKQAALNPQNTQAIQNPTPSSIPNSLTQDPSKKKDDLDWLLDDPFGFDLIQDEAESSDESELSVSVQTTDTHTVDVVPQHPRHITSEQSAAENAAVQPPAMTSMQNKENWTDQAAPEINMTKTALHDIHSNTTNSAATQTTASQSTEIETSAEPDLATANTTAVVSNQHPHIVITPATIDLQGPRQLILDTETTGFYFQDTDRIVEVGAIEMINRKLTGGSIHIYIQPGKDVGDSERIHGISDKFLLDKPKYAEIAAVLFDYLKGAEIIAHNAAFDMNFLNMEFKRSGFVALSDVCSVTDTLAMAKAKHPGQKNSLDALVRRYDIQQRDRTFHGALLDAEILADVYLAMTGGQVSFDMDSSESEEQRAHNHAQRIEIDLPVIRPSTQELEAHEQWVAQYQEKNAKACLFAK